MEIILHETINSAKHIIKDFDLWSPYWMLY